MVKHLTLIVTGKVQGVFYRASARDVAISLGLKGIVSNLPDGNVQIEVEGEQEIINKFYSWCLEGPPRAVVDKIRVSEGAIQGYADFRIEMSAS
jgi:acylphosphatase